jgi:hypothetical protein
MSCTRQDATRKIVGFSSIGAEIAGMLLQQALKITPESAQDQGTCWWY